MPLALVWPPGVVNFFRFLGWWVARFGQGRVVVWSEAEPGRAESCRPEPGRGEPTHFVLQLHLPRSVSSTRNARLRKAPLFNERLVYVRCTSSKSSVVSSTQDATFLKTNAPRLHQMPTLGSGSHQR